MPRPFLKEPEKIERRQLEMRKRWAGRNPGPRPNQVSEGDLAFAREAFTAHVMLERGCSLATVSEKVRWPVEFIRMWDECGRPMKTG